MNDFHGLSPNVAFTPIGLEVIGEISFEEWHEIGLRIGRAMRAASFVVGDWMVYGEGRMDSQRTFWPDIPATHQVPTDIYDEAVRITGMDRQTLHNYAWVARNVPASLRSEELSFEHHKKVAKLKTVEQKSHWLALALKCQRSEKPISTRRLGRSIEAGRLLSPAEMQADDADRGIENCHPFVNAICAFFGKLRQGGWFETASPEKLAALKRDLQPVVDLYNQL